MTTLIFGYGYIGKAYTRLAGDNRFIITAREPFKRQTLQDSGQDKGFEAIDPSDSRALQAALEKSKSVLITAAPNRDGCPGYLALQDMLKSLPPKWLAYLSTTGVYGDASGHWVDETSPLRPSSPEARNRVLAETQWQGLKNQHALAIFRLPGLYGQGRNILEKLADKTARRINKAGHVFSRLHHDDCARALVLAQTQQACGVFNLCDDEPASADEVLIYGANLLGQDLPPLSSLEDEGVSEMTRRFYSDNKRVSNAKAKAVLGWRPIYPTYREGLKSLMRPDLIPQG